MAELDFKAVRKNYGNVEVIKGIDFSIKHGEFVVFVGPSGCGKSTLLRMITGLEEITSGTISIDGAEVNNVEPQDRGVAMVFQSYALYPHMSVYDNVGFSLKLAKAPKAERDKAIRDAARILQMESLLDRKPAELSGGQRQRVAIGRAIVRNPSVFLFDEPLSNLDAALRGDMRAELAELHSNLGATMIYVTHDQVEAMTLADKIVVLESGVVQQIGSPLELYSNPANLFVAGFIGSPRMNFFDVQIDKLDDITLKVSGPDIQQTSLPRPRADLNLSQSLTIGIRPHALARKKTTAISGQIELVENLGHETIVSIRLQSGGKACAALEGNEHRDIGSHIKLGFDPEHVHVFDKTGTCLVR